MQELEQRLLEAEQRAENAETQVGVMEENVKLSNLMNVDSAGSLHRKYQELLKAMQGKDELISELEAQLEKKVSTSALCSSWSSCPQPLSRAPLLQPLVAGAHSLTRLFIRMEM